MKYSETRKHMVALRQCAIFAADVGPSIAKSMTDAADFLESLIPVLEHTERKVLMVLQSVGEDYSLNFKGLADNFHRMFGSEIDVATAKKYCRSLRDKGLAVHRNGLFDDSTSLTAGSGYSATDEGMRFNVR